MNQEDECDFVIIEPASRAIVPYSLVRKIEWRIARYLRDYIAASTPRILAYGVIYAIGTGSATTTGSGIIVYILANAIKYGFI
jgi:hypothetical protein